MAITGPTNFRANKATAKPGEEIIFTWTAATGDFDGYIYDFGAPNNVGVGIIRSSTQTSLTKKMPDESHIGYKPDDYFEVSIFAVKGIRTTDDYDEKGPTSSVKVYYDVSGGDTPEPVTSGKLEQFQNSAGEQIYPRTIIEGIFRQSDSKPLLEILAELLDVSGGPELELPLGIADGGTGADNAKEGIFNLTSSLNDVIAHKSFKNMFFPYIDTDNDSTAYKMPFSQIQKWINNRTGMVNQENTDYDSFIARGIAAGTSDYAAGSTAMTNGTIYLVYE